MRWERAGSEPKTSDAGVGETGPEDGRPGEEGLPGSGQGQHSQATGRGDPGHGSPEMHGPQSMGA